MDDLTDIQEWYNNSWDGEETRLVRHQLEADISWMYLDRYLPPSGKILEVGFGTGHYTFGLAKQGYEITAVDLAEDFVARCSAKATELGMSDRITFLAGDARTLDDISRNQYDAVLLMGPLYHLVLENDRAAALQAAYSCLNVGGVILSALISRYGILGTLLKDHPSWIQNQAEVWSLMKHGHRPPEAPREGFRGYFVRLDEVARMHEAVGFESLKIAGLEPAISADDESFNELKGKERDLWLELLFDLSAEESVVAASRHILYVGRKGEAEKGDPGSV